MATVTRTLQLLVGASWVDLTADVLDRNPIKFSRGISGSGPLDLVAKPGMLSFDLDDSEDNSASTLGYYSPLNANCRSGFKRGAEVRLKLDDGAGHAVYIWRGRIATIQADAGRYGNRGTAVTANDWMQNLADVDAADLTLLADVTSDALISALIALPANAVTATDLDTGADTYEFAFDDLGGNIPKCMAVAQEICQSERGYLYIRGDATGGETLRYENRYARALAASVLTLTDTDLVMDDGNPEVPADLSMVFNDITTEVYPRSVDAAATTVLVSLSQEVLISPGVPVTMFVDYRDPANQAQFVGGKDMVDPVATTDYTGNASSGGGGTDKTSTLTVTATFFGSRCMLVISTSDASAVYLRGPGTTAGMQIRGRGLYRYAAVTSRGQNATSIAEVGSRQLPSVLAMTYQSDPAIGQGVADLIANLYGLNGTPTRVQVDSRGQATMLAQALTRDIGDRITVSELVTLPAGDAIIQAVEGEVGADGILSTWWTLAPAETTDVLIWDSGNWDEHAWAYA